MWKNGLPAKTALLGHYLDSTVLGTVYGTLGKLLCSWSYALLSYPRNCPSNFFTSSACA